MINFGVFIKRAYILYIEFLFSDYYIVVDYLR